MSRMSEIHADLEKLGALQVVELQRDVMRKIICELQEENERLKAACYRALNYIENTESELGIKLGCADALRNALQLALPLEDNDADPDDDTGDRDFSDGDNPLDDPDGAALASVWGPND